MPEIRSVVGINTSISAQANIGGHFSQRREIYCYPNKVGEVDVIILRLVSPTANINNIPNQLIGSRKDMIYTLDGQLQMDRKEYIASVEKLLSGKEYGILLWSDPWLVLKRGEVHQKSQQA